MIATKKIVSTAALAAISVFACSTGSAHVEATAMYRSPVYPKCKAEHFNDAYKNYNTRFYSFIKYLPDDTCFEYKDNTFWRDWKLRKNTFFKIFIAPEANENPVEKFTSAMCERNCAIGPDAYNKYNAALYIFQQPKYKYMGRDIKCSVNGKNVEDILDEVWDQRSNVCKANGYLTASAVEDYVAPPLSDAEGDQPQGDGITEPAAAPSPNAPAPAPAPNTDTNKKTTSGASVVSCGVTFLVTLASLVLAATTMF